MKQFSFNVFSLDQAIHLLYILTIASGYGGRANNGGKEMIGSEKQIEWAQKIKPQVVALAEDEMVQQSISRGATDEFLGRLRAALNKAADEQDARFWIDGRLNGRTPDRETFKTINVLRRRTAEILKEKKNDQTTIR